MKLYIIVRIKVNKYVHNVCSVLQGDVYGYKHALAISQYEVEDAPMRDRERVSANTVIIHFTAFTPGQCG